MANWLIDLDSIIFSRIKRGLEKKLKKDFKDLLVTSVDKTPDKAIFPTVYIKTLESSERGQTLGEPVISAVMYSLQIEVITAENEGQAKRVMGEVINILKKMFFNVSTPISDNTQSTFRLIMRANRMIGSGDIL